MKVTARPSEVRDVLTVIADASEATMFDFSLINLEPEELLRVFMQKAKQTDTNTFIENGKVIAVLGWDKTDSGWYSWLVTTPRALVPEASPVFAARKVLKQIRRANPKTPLLSITASDDEKTRHWMRCLGFQRVFPLAGKFWVYL